MKIVTTDACHVYTIYSVDTLYLKWRNNGPKTQAIDILLEVTLSKKELKKLGLKSAVVLIAGESE